MIRKLNLCTAVLPNFLLGEVIEIASRAGYRGIELRVDDRRHIRLEDLQHENGSLKRSLRRAGLQVAVLSSYIGLNEEAALANLLKGCQRLDVPHARVVLPRSGQAAVAQQAQVPQVLPSYDDPAEPAALLNGVKQRLRSLEHQARLAGVKVLIELHWGTIMSSFSSAYHLVHDLDPDQIGVTFDPANMLVEGKEDWEFGIKLLGAHLANVHVKNVEWQPEPSGWRWAWAPLTQGMVDWASLTGLLSQNGYAGAYAIEDFLALNTSKQAAVGYLTEVRTTFERLHTGDPLVTNEQRSALPPNAPRWRQPAVITTNQIYWGNGLSKSHQK